MKDVGGIVVAARLWVTPMAGWAHEAHEHGAGGTEPAAETTAQEPTLTGEVVDVFCYL